MVSYADIFAFGITADYDGAPDVDELAAGIERPPPSHGWSRCAIPLGRSRCELASTVMNGARALLNTFVDGGINVCFANPGTSEMHFVAALDAVPEMRGSAHPVRGRGHRGG